MVNVCKYNIHGLFVYKVYFFDIHSTVKRCWKLRSFFSSKGHYLGGMLQRDLYQQNTKIIGPNFAYLEFCVVVISFHTSKFQISTPRVQDLVHWFHLWMINQNNSPTTRNRQSNLVENLTVFPGDFSPAWRIIVVSNHGDRKSPKDQVVPLPNGINGKWMGVIRSPLKWDDSPNGDFQGWRLRFHWHRVSHGSIDGWTKIPLGQISLHNLTRPEFHLKFLL